VLDDALEALGLTSLPKEALGPCVYFLYQDGRLIYIGRTKNLLGRFQRHKVRNFDEVKIFRCQAKDLRTLEARFIKAFRPEQNEISGVKIEDSNPEMRAPVLEAIIQQSLDRE
jgi:hypothetical protein